MRMSSAPLDMGWTEGLAHRLIQPWTRNVRLTVPVCLILICGSFAAATLLSVRMDRLHALNQASLFESNRARDLAAVAAANLDRFATAGALYADRPGSEPSAAGLRNIAVFDRGGDLLSLWHRQGIPALPAAAAAGNRLVY